VFPGLYLQPSSLNFSQILPLSFSLPVTNDGCPISAKTGQIWGTRHLLPVEREAFVPGRERRVREKFRLGSAQLPQQLFPASSQNHRRRAMSLDLAAFDHQHIRRVLEDFRYIM
jgi:hypothetical protein